MTDASNQLRVLSDIGRSLATFIDLDDLVHYATRRTRELFGAEGCALLLLDRERGGVLLSGRQPARIARHQRRAARRDPLSGRSGRRRLGAGARRSGAGRRYGEGRALLQCRRPPDVDAHAGVAVRAAAHARRQHRRDRGGQSGRRPSGPQRPRLPRRAGQRDRGRLREGGAVPRARARGDRPAALLPRRPAGGCRCWRCSSPSRRRSIIGPASCRGRSCRPSAR